MDDKKRKYCDKRAFELVSLIKNFKSDKLSRGKIKGSFQEKEALDWRDKIVDAPSIISDTLVTGEKINIKRLYKDSCFGFDYEGYKEFVKLNKVFHKGYYSEKVSLSFINNCSFEWFIDIYINNKATQSYCDYLTDLCIKSIESYTVEFPVLYLDIFRDIDVGNCKVFYYTRSYIEKLIENYEGKDKASYKKLMSDKLQGQVFISHNYEGEINKAREVALSECSLAIDVLRICSKTTVLPNYKLSFDIDERVSETIMAESITKHADKPDEFIFNKFRRPNPYHISEKEWKDIKSCDIDIFSTFLKKERIRKNEIDDLVILAIKIYSRSLSITDLPSRIVQVFTVFEMLLVKNSNSPILADLCTYGSKLLFNKIEDRKHFISLMKRMYAIRSAKVHHAKNKSININDLRQLQVSLIMLLSCLIKMSQHYNSKQEILDTIDDRILKA